MNNHATHRLAMALALIYSLPLALVGCATQPAAQTVAATPIAPMPVTPAKAKANSEVITETAVASAKQTEADNATKIIPGTGVFVRPATVLTSIRSSRLAAAIRSRSNRAPGRKVGPSSSM